MRMEKVALLQQLEDMVVKWDTKEWLHNSQNNSVAKRIPLLLQWETYCHKMEFQVAP